MLVPHQPFQKIRRLTFSQAFHNDYEVTEENALQFSAWPFYNSAQIAAESSAFAAGDINYWTGSRCRSFEKKFAEFLCTRYVVALANGTFVSDFAQRALGNGLDYEVIITSSTFVVSVSTFINSGVKPILAGFDADSGNVYAASVTVVLTEKTRTVIPAHLSHWPCDMPAIMELAARNGSNVIEDCAQARGTRIGGQSLGSFGHIRAWSSTKIRS
jgi:dTDP-4-amino-4,6-dideoxygalactose transaminase